VIILLFNWPKDSPTYPNQVILIKCVILLGFVNYSLNYLEMVTLFSRCIKLKGSIYELNTI